MGVREMARRKIAVVFASALLSISGAAMAGSEDELARARAAYQAGDLKKSFDIALSAARAGHVEAFGIVATHYLDGIGTPSDERKAAFWAKKSADAGRSYGQLLLARLYVNGQGVPRNVFFAVSYAQKALQQGEGSAQQLIDFVEKYEGRNSVTCMKYGFQPLTEPHASCVMQIDIALQQAQFQQRQHELQVAQYQQQLAAYEAQQKAIEKEKRRREGEVLMRMAQGLLGGQSFSDSSLAAYGFNTTRPTPPPSAPATQNYTIRLPNGNQVYCNYNSLASYMSCR